MRTVTPTSNFTKLDPEFKERLITALSDGSYPKTNGVLRSANHHRHGTGFCCLGVVCDLVDPNGWNNENLAEGRAVGIHHLQDYDESDGGAYICGKVICAEAQGTLAAINDSSLTFEPVIDWIKENL